MAVPTLRSLPSSLVLRSIKVLPMAAAHAGGLVPVTALDAASMQALDELVPAGLSKAWSSIKESLMKPTDPPIYLAYSVPSDATSWNATGFSPFAASDIHAVAGASAGPCSVISMLKQAGVGGCGSNSTGGGGGGSGANGTGGGGSGSGGGGGSGSHELNLFMIDQMREMHEVGRYIATEHRVLLEQNNLLRIQFYENSMRHLKASYWVVGSMYTAIAAIVSFYLPYVNRVWTEDAVKEMEAKQAERGCPGDGPEKKCCCDINRCCNPNPNIKEEPDVSAVVPTVASPSPTGA